MNSMAYLPKVVSSEPNRVNSLLIETITLLCRNGLSFTKQLKIEGMIGITIDDSEIALIHINEFLLPNSSESQQHCRNESLTTSYNKSATNNTTDCSKYKEAPNSHNTNDNQSFEQDLKPNGNKEFIVESPFFFNNDLPSDEEESHEKVGPSRKENRQLGCSDSRQQNLCDESAIRSSSFDLPNPPGTNEKSGDLEKSQLDVDRIKCETIDITDEEGCEAGGDYGRVVNDRRFVGLEGVFGNNCPMVDPMFHRGLNNAGPYQGRETGLNDGFNNKSLIKSDDFFVSMNLEEQLPIPRLRDDSLWQGTSRYRDPTIDNDYDSVRIILFD